jgi:hypothetical protein
MRKLFCMAICCLFLFSFQGCTAKNKTTAVEVTIEGGGKFPDALVGTWMAEPRSEAEEQYTSPEIVFEPNGIISSAVISFGRVRLMPGRTTVVPMVNDKKGTYKSGVWSVKYSPDDRRLTVDIVVDSFEAFLGNDSVRGSVQYVYDGPVSPDSGVWNAEMFEIPKYIVNTKEHPNYELPIDLNDIGPPLVFRKVK